MSEKLTKVIQIAEQAQNAEEIVLFTDSFKAKGKLFKDKSKAVDGIITLTDAVVCPLFDKCECKGSLSTHHDWLNVFEENIVAFTVLKD